jgi:hypothetical protein
MPWPRHKGDAKKNRLYQPHIKKFNQSSFHSLINLNKE